MHRLRLISSPFVDPRWFHMPEQTATALDTKTIKVYGEIFKLSDIDDFSLIPGETVYVWPTRNFMMESKRERDVRLQQQEELRVKQEQESRERDNKVRKEAEAFNATLHVPVSWKVGMKDVLSGLSANSAGNGCNAASVFHIWLQEDIHEGRFVRNAFDFLCTTASGSNGKQWSQQIECTWDDGDHNKYSPKVTCKTCLKLAQRWKR